MIVCPNCQSDNMAGAAFCAECGISLLPSEAATTHRIEIAEKGGARDPARPAVTSPVDSGDVWLTLHLLDTGQLLPLANRNEFTLGRMAENQPVLPDIDLSPYQAYSHGVSRLHAVIKRGVADVYLMDLESANGTYVNGRRLDRHEECALAHGDVVSLGRLKMQILLRSE